MIRFLRFGGLIDDQWRARNLRPGIFIIIFIALAVAGCGEEPERQHYEPLSPLPLRVSGSGAVTPMPLSATTPTAPEASETPLQTPSATPTPVTDNATPTPKLPGVTPTPAPISSAPPTPKPQKTPTQKPQTPGTSEQPKQTNHPSDGVSSDAVSQNEKTANLETDETSTSETPEQEERDPIVTPYDITLDRLMVCAAVKNRAPVGCEQSFSLAETGRVFTWMKVSDVKAPKVIKHVYFLEDEQIATVTLNLKYAAMRTWSQKTFKPDQIGNWKVVVMTGTDEVIAVRSWVVTP